MFATGFSMQVEKTAEPAQGPTQQFLSQLRAIPGPTFWRASSHRAPMAAAGTKRSWSIHREERYLRYCKLHPFSLGGEDQHYARGDETCSFTWGPFHVAPFVCYDLRFPEIFRHQTRLGAQVLVVIANWPEARDIHWQTLLRARAIENQAYVIGVNRAGNDPKFVYRGHSVILDPHGETLAMAAEKVRS